MVTQKMKVTFKDDNDDNADNLHDGALSAQVADPLSSLLHGASRHNDLFVIFIIITIDITSPIKPIIMLSIITLALHPKSFAKYATPKPWFPSVAVTSNKLGLTRDFTSSKLWKMMIGG